MFLFSSHLLRFLIYEKSNESNKIERHTTFFHSKTRRENSHFILNQNIYECVFFSRKTNKQQNVISSFTVYFFFLFLHNMEYILPISIVRDFRLTVILLYYLHIDEIGTIKIQNATKR